MVHRSVMHADFLQDRAQFYLLRRKSKEKYGWLQLSMNLGKSNEISWAEVEFDWDSEVKTLFLERQRYLLIVFLQISRSKHYVLLSVVTPRIIASY